MARYGIASLFETYPDGYEFTEANTPLHLTHVDVLEIDYIPEIFLQKLREYFQYQPAFDIMPLADIFFGPNKDIPVTVIELDDKLKLFHENLIQFLESNGASFDNPHFLKGNYGPHISIYGERRVAIGQALSVKSVSIGHKRINIDNPPNRIVTTIPLQ